MFLLQLLNLWLFIAPKMINKIHLYKKYTYTPQEFKSKE